MLRLVSLLVLWVRWVRSWSDFEIRVVVHADRSVRFTPISCVEQAGYR